MIPTWVILTPFAAIGVACLVFGKLAKRREDREWARGIAQRVHDRRYLEFLEEQFASEGSAQ